MALAQAIRKNSLSLAVKQTTYKQNVVAVNTLINSVLSSNLPTLHQNPPDWDDFVNAYEKANSQSLDWVNNVMARLLDVPDNVRNYNDAITQTLTNAKTQAHTLISDPSNKGALSTLHADLNNLTSQLGLITTFISGALTSLQNFKDVLPSIASELQTIANDSTKAAKADQQQIDKLNTDIDNLHSEIKSLTNSIIGLGIADGVALTLGVVATVAAFPVGALTWLVLGPAIAVATTYIVLDAEKIKADKALIEQDEAEIKGLTADVSTLHILSKNFAAMSSETVAIEDNLQAILNEWQTLETDVSNAVTDIRTAIADSGSADFNGVVSELTDAAKEWDAAYQQAGGLHLDLNVNDAVLQVGMTQDEIKSAVAAANTTDIIAYYNKVQGQRSVKAA